jgi:hypothetical protein
LAMGLGALAFADRLAGRILAARGAALPS